MSGKSASGHRSAAQLRRGLRNWRVRAMWQAGLTSLFVASTAACWWWQASVVLWGLSFTGMVSSLIGIAADLNACHTTKARIREIDSTTA